MRKEVEKKLSDLEYEYQVMMSDQQRMTCRESVVDKQLMN